MTTPYPKRLIEVDLPIKRISAHARREKSTSTITGVHLWWARRPLAACRAVVCASLWPDPADPGCPPAFVDRAREALLQFAAHARAEPSVTTLCGDSWSIWLHVDDRSLDATTDHGRRGLRDLLLTFIGDFANPRATSQLRFVEAARSLTRAAHEVLAESQSAYPIVLDPFAGGGSIPLEALRVGASALAGDINPVALLINDVLVRLAPSAGSATRERIRQTARSIAGKASQRLAALYPQRPGRVTVAYLWARTVLSEAPGAGEMPVEVPLIRSMWLSKRAGNMAALRWVRDGKRAIISDVTDVTYADGTQRPVLRPRLEIFHPVSHAEVEAGTTSGGGVVCPVTEYTTPKDRVRVQLTPRRGGTRDARMLAIVTRPTAGNGREFHLPDESDTAAIRGAERMFGGLSDVVDEPLPVGRVWKNNPFRIHNYGMTSWGDLFTHRQHVALSTLAEAVTHASVEPAEDRAADLTHSLLALTVARLADHMNSGCTWNPGGEKLQHLFARQAVPMVWDFCEANPFGGSVGDWLAMVEGAVDALGFVPTSTAPGDVFAASAEACPAPDDSIDATITDPPYYDAVPYADLSEFFYVWLRRCAPRARASWFAAPLVDRRPEIVLDENRAKDAAFYVRSMTAAFSEARRVTKPAGLGVVVFAHKSTAGWEALLQAVLDAGWVITASWPIDTELATRVRAMSSAALASSVHLVCRPRENPDGAIRTDAIGDWRDILTALPKRIHEWMPRLAEEGVVGADAIFACLGPALEIFSRYSRVEKASGEQVTLKEYLEHVWAAVAKEALSVIFAGAETSGFEEDARLTAMWLWTLSTGGVDGKPESGRDGDEADDDEDAGAATKKAKPAGFVLEYDAARKIAQGLGAHLEDLTSLVEVKGETARLLPVAERTRALFGKDEADAPTARRKKKAQQMTLGFADELEEAEEAGGWGQKGAPQLGQTVLDRVHQSMILFAAGRGEALRRFLVDESAGRDSRFWRLAQALAALYPTGTDERRWVEGVLARKKGLGF